MANVVQHAQATEMKLDLVGEAGELALTVEDNGRGFSLERLAESLRDGHVGLAAQRHRIEAAGGRMDIASAPGGGTRVDIRLPSST